MADPIHIARSPACRQLLSAVLAGLDRLPYGFVVADAEGLPFLANAAARDMLASHPLEWRRRLAEAVKTGGVSSAPVEMPTAFVAAVLVPDAPDAGDPLRAACFLIEPGRLHSVNVEWIRQVYSLTTAEARLAALLLCGAGIDDAARQLRVTRHTVRVHLKRVFAKTATKSQSQLLRLLVLSGALLDHPADSRRAVLAAGRAALGGQCPDL